MHVRAFKHNTPTHLYVTCLSVHRTTTAGLDTFIVNVERISNKVIFNYIFILTFIVNVERISNKVIFNYIFILNSMIFCKHIVVVCALLRERVCQ